MIKAGTVDAQENPLSNTVTYGVHKFHRFHTLSNHFYISRPIFIHRAAFDGWPGDLQRAMRAAVTDAVAFQRDAARRRRRKTRERPLRRRAARSSSSPPPSTPPSRAAVKPLLDEARQSLWARSFSTWTAESVRLGGRQPLPGQPALARRAAARISAQNTLYFDFGA